MKIKLNNQNSIDLPKLISGKLLIQANSGGGKSWCIRRLVEQAYGKVQIIIIDPEGEFSTLREKFDFVLAGKGGDTPAESRSAALLARKLLELEVSTIIDLYELHPQERKHFVKLFLESMINAPKELYHDCLVVLDEAHMFVPEKDESEAGSAVRDLASRGRKRGYSAVLATQRISKLAKDVAAECNNKLIGRTSLDIDRKRAADELGITSKEEILALRTLQPGEFFAFGPAISDEVIKVKVGEVQTSVPKAGSLTKVTPPTAHIKQILAKLGDLPQEAKKEAETISSLKAEIRTLQAHKCPDVKQSPVKVEKIEVPTIGKRAMEKFEKSSKEIKMMLGKAKEFYKLAESITESVLSAVELLSKDVEKVKNASVASPARSIARPVIQKTKRQYSPLPVDGEFRPSSSQQKILNALMWAESINISPCDKTQVALLADQSPTSGGYFNNLGALRTAGLISYPSPGTLALTDAGREVAEVTDVPTTDEELHRQLFNKISSSQKAILQALIAIYPDPIPKSELAEQCGQSSTSGGYFNNLGRLRSLKLIDYPSPGMVVAEKVLFIK